LKEFEILFFMNPTGDIFNDAEQKIFEAWMRDGGAFAGTHSATDTENGWAFYSEVTGQYYNGHGAQNTMGQIRFEETALTHPSVAGLPNPWVRSEEWYNFNQWQTWTAKPGFRVLGRLVTGSNQPISYIREWGNFRSFYTAIGHADVVFKDATVKKHITGGIMWAVRREHLIK
jgi:type 1 glutamine amidotransferase